MSAADAAAGGNARLHELVDALYSEIDAALVAGGPGAIDPGVVRRINTVGVKLYAAQHEAGFGSDPVQPGTAVTATEVSLFCSKLLQVVNLELFELSLWRKFGTE
ncbi:hypothetical protein [Mycobacterium sp. NAZ190054]|uniref:hypothetical protein n=1 Tax=Mycobacterium sp. NAZ190054 TaxID=1747766 RepID=UPI000793CE13|nr:hypothetical protein [Mycobacterium sp. NAZ190054]KWX67400.1 hypothetical protein ASJ79_21670 [Mycobacterium sp. NAZ190054]